MYASAFVRDPQRIDEERAVDDGERRVGCGEEKCKIKLNVSYPSYMGTLNKETHGVQ
jgi:hypothetical protein